MIIFKRASDLSQYLNAHRAGHFSIGFVPTMGALHQGHMELLIKSKKNADLTVCSIFVNPTQFNDQSDFEKYPVTLDKDIMLLETNKVDILFLPSVTEIYPEGFELKQQYELDALETVFEGSFRPGHFQGVCQVVDRLLSIVQPDTIFMGQKDFQQCMVISRLLELRHPHTIMEIVPTIREADGLAMSSRNTRLSSEARKKATILFKTLSRIKADLASEPISMLLEVGNHAILEEGFEKIDYLSIADPSTLQETLHFKKNHPYVILVAAFIEGVRLIDNIVINPTLSD